MVLNLSKHSSADLAGNCGQQKVTSSCIHVWVQQQCIRLYPHVMSLSQNEIYQFWWVYIYIYSKKKWVFLAYKKPLFCQNWAHGHLHFFLKCVFGVRGKIAQAITFLSTARSEDYLIFSHPLFHVYWLTQIVGKMSKIFYVIQTLNYLLGNGKWRTAWLNTHCSNMQTFATK